jgi:hypothetical protein
MDLRELMQSAKRKEFRSEVLSQSKQVFGTPYTVGDAVRMAALYELDDEAFFFAELVNLLTTKYGLDEQVARTLTVVEIMWLMKDLRINSSGPEVEADCRCSHCRHVNVRQKIDLMKIKIVNQENFKYEITAEDGAVKYVLQMKVPDAVTFYRIFGGLKIAGPGFVKAVEEKNAEMLKASTVLIVANGEIIDPAIQPPADLAEFFDKFLPSSVLEKFDDMSDKLPTVKLDQMIKCDKCGKEFPVEPLDFFFSAL